MAIAIREKFRSGCGALSTDSSGDNSIVGFGSKVHDSNRSEGVLSIDCGHRTKAVFVVVYKFDRGPCSASDSEGAQRSVG